MNTTSSLNQTELEHFREQTLLEACQKLTAINKEVLGMLVNFTGANPNLPNQVNQLIRINAQLEQVAGVYTQPTDMITISFSTAPGENEQAELRVVLDALQQRCGAEHVHPKHLTCDSKLHQGLIMAAVSITTAVITSGFNFAKEWVKAHEGRHIEVSLHGVKLPVNDDAAVATAIKLLEILQKQELERRNQQQTHKEDASAATSERK